MPDLKDLQKTLNWKLQAGSHEFPGDDGGTCINEAAVVAAGFEYRPVNSVGDLPKCFSWTISQFALELNDTMPAGLRQELLLPFVLRLANSADTMELEVQRTAFMVRAVVERDLVPVQKAVAAGLFYYLECAERQLGYAQCFYGQGDYPTCERSKGLCRDSCLKSVKVLAGTICGVARTGMRRKLPLEQRRTEQHEYFVKAVAVMDEALTMGNHGSELEIEAVRKRFGEMRSHEEDQAEAGRDVIERALA